MAEVKTVFAALKKENEQLKSSAVVLSHEVTNWPESRVRAMEQYARNNNVRETPGEVISAVVRDMGHLLGVNVQDHQVSAMHRILSYKKERTPASIM